MGPNATSFIPDYSGSVSGQVSMICRANFYNTATQAGAFASYFDHDSTAQATAMGVRLAPLPVIPMPGLDRTHHAGPPLRPKLRGRREIRDALVIQSVLRPAKAFAP